MEESKSRQRLWPLIKDITTARRTALQGCWASIYCSCATLLFVLLTLFGVKIIEVSLWALLDVAIFGVLAWAIYKLSTIAAILGLLIYLLERVDAFLRRGPESLAGYIIMVCIILAFLNSIRGTLAFHKFKSAQQLSGSL